jgi:hypothetical protein
MSSGLNVGDLVAVLRLKDEMTPAMQAAAAAAARNLGNLTGLAQAANQEVARLKKEWIETEDVAKRGDIAKTLGEAAIGAASLNSELAKTKKNLNDALGGGGAEKSLADGFIGEAAKFAAGISMFEIAERTVSTVVGGITSTLKESVAAYGDQEAATLKLTAALRAQHVDVDNVLPSYANMATALQRQTVYADENLMAMQALLVQIGGVMPADMDRALKASTDLASGLGIDLESATRLVAKAAAGHTETLGRYGITVSQSELATKGFSAVLEQVETHFGGQAQAAADSYNGRVKQLGNTWNDFEETIGKFLVTNPLVVKAMNDVEAKIRDVNKAAADGDQTWGSFIENQINRYTRMIPVVNTLTQGTAEYVKYKEDEAAAELELQRIYAQASARAPKLPTADGLSPIAWRDVLSDGDKVKAVIGEVTRALEKLTPAQTEAATAALKHGLSVGETLQALREQWPAIDRSKISIEALKKSLDDATAAGKKHAEEIKKDQQALRDYTAANTDLYDQLASETIEAIKSDLTRITNQETLARVYGVTKEQIALIIKAVKEETAAEKENQKELDATIKRMDAFEKTGTEAAKAVADGLKGMPLVLKSIGIELNTIQLAADKVFAGQGGLAPDLSARAAEHMRELYDRTTEDVKATEALADAFQKLGQTAGGSTGVALTGLGSLLSIYAKFQNGDLTGKQAGWAAVGAGAGIIAGLTANPQSTGGYIANGAAQGAAIGTSIVPGWGTAIGAGAGAIAGWIASMKEWRKVSSDLSRDFGNIHFSEDLSKSIADLEDATGLQRAQATLTQLDKIVAEAGGLNAKNLDMFTGKFRDAFVYLHDGTMNTAQVTQLLDKNWQQFATAGTDNLGLLNAKLVEFIHLDEAAGTHSKAIADYVGQQLTNAEKGFAGALSVTNAAYDKRAAIQTSIADITDRLSHARGADAEALQKQLDEANKALQTQQAIIDTTALHSQAAATAVAGSIIGVINVSMSQGKSFMQAIAESLPAFDALDKQLKETGFSGGEAFDFIRQEVELARDEVAGPALQAIAGYTQGLVGLNNAGRMNEDTFRAIASQIAQTEAALVAQGKDGGAVMAAMQSDLQTVWELQHRFNYTVDEATQDLLNQAEAAGLVGESHKDMATQTVDGLNKIVDRLDLLLKGMGIDLPDAAGDAADALVTAAGHARDALSDVDGHIAQTADRFRGLGRDAHDALDGLGGNGSDTNYNANGGFIRYLAGGGFLPRGTDTVPAMLTPGELVLNAAQQRTLAGQLHDGKGSNDQELTRVVREMAAEIVSLRRDLTGRIPQMTTLAVAAAINRSPRDRR